MPVLEGEKITIKIHDKCKKLIPFSDLGFEKNDQKKILRTVSLEPEVIVVSGLRGGGKSGTLYGIISQYKTDETSIITVENPIKQKVPGIIQCEIGKENNTTTKKAIEAAVLQDPDVLMVSNVSDKETAQKAFEAAALGHKVYLSLNAKDSFETIIALERFGLEPQKMASYLNQIIAQKLVRRICPYCIRETVLDDNQKKIVNEEIEKIPAKLKEDLIKGRIKFFKGKGCKRCSGSGYDKTLLLYEILEINSLIKEEIVQRSKGLEIEKIARNNGMITITQYGIIKAIEGKTTVEEVLN